MDYDEDMVDELSKVLTGWIQRGSSENLCWLAVAEFARRSAIILEELKHIPGDV